MITAEELKEINKLNEAIKDLDPILKERLVEYGLSRIFKDDYHNILKSLKNSEIGDQIIEKDGMNSKIQDNVEEILSMKDFFDEKKPSTIAETVTVFGFYLEHHENLKEFSEQEIADCFFRARTRKPKVIGQALRDAKNVKGYLVEGTKKGKFRLSNIGENLVMHDLPNGDAK